MVFRFGDRLSYSSVATAAVGSAKPSLCFPYDYSDFSQIIRSCRSLRSLLQAHAQSLTRGAQFNDSLRFLLVNSYSSFGRSDLSLSVFNSSPQPSIRLWNTMLRAYTVTGEHAEGIRFYHSMLQQCVNPDKYTFTFAVKACAGALDFENGSLIHDEIKRRNRQEDVYIGTALVDMYSKLGMVETASELFDSMPRLDIVTWNAMIAGFSLNNQPHRALALLGKMLSVGLIPNLVTILNLFPAVCELCSALLCRSLHGFITRSFLFPAVGNGLIDAYCKCGRSQAARQVFDHMEGSRDDISWATMISGYVYGGHFTDALKLFDDSKKEDLRLNQVSVLSALSAAAETGDLQKGVKIHTYVVDEGIDLDISLTTMLATMYAKCGDVENAKFLFDGMLQKDIVAWSAMIAAFAQSGQPKEALYIFREMLSKSITPNSVTLVSILPACADLLDLILGKSIHCFALKSNISLDGPLGSALVAMYAQCGSLISANNLFDSLQNKDVVTWNALINGSAQSGGAENALLMFHNLQTTGLQPDHGTIMGALSACGFLDKLTQGTCFYGLVVKKGFGSDLHVKNALLDMFAKCGDLTAAKTIFCEVKSSADVVSWNTMIAGYLHNGCANEAMSAFYKMRAENFMPNLVTLVSIIPTAACLSSLRDGFTLHSITIKTGFESHLVVRNSLIDMYSKCGRLDFARNLFDQMDCRSTITWNAMLAGYAMHGIVDSAIDLFCEMKESCILPDSVSFVSLLSACRHGGLVDEGRKFFKSMCIEYGLEPNKKHYAAMVDLLGCAGHFDEALELINGIPKDIDASVWGALLGAAKIHSNLKMGELAVEHLVQLEPKSPSHFVILANIYASSGRWADAGKMRTMIRNMGLCKSPGCSWVDSRKTSHLTIGAA